MFQQEFQNEKLLISDALGSEVVKAIHHIGSTSVKGLCAKPIIDILLEVNCLQRLDELSTKMEALGYLVKGEFGIEGRRYFQKGGVQRSHQVHAFKSEDPHVERHLAFRDYLSAFPEIKEQYGALKQEAVKVCGNDIEKYIAHKNDFIKYHELEALNWLHA